MFNLSSAEGKKWADICTMMTERIKGLGPSPVRGAAKPVEAKVEIPEPAKEAVV